MLKLSFLGEVWDAVYAEITRAHPVEEGAFLLGRAVGTAHGARVIVDRAVDPPDRDKWRLQNEGQLAPTSEYMSRTAGLADNSARIPVFVHSHPFGPANFSLTDDWAHEAWAPFFVENVQQAAFISVVVAGRDLAADMWIGGARFPFDVVTCAGADPRRSVRKVAEYSVHSGMEAAYSRQEILWKRRGQFLLANSRVGIIGLGGTGSSAAVQLGRAGVGELVLIDPDGSDMSNLNRLYCLEVEQARERLAKVFVVSRGLSQIAATTCVAIQRDVRESIVQPELLECDVILGCTDSQSSRAHLNQVALVNGIPYVDAGCRAESSGAEIISMWADVRRVVSGGPCLFCMDVISSDVIAAEGLPSETHRLAERDGYVLGSGLEPSVIVMTTTAAAIATSQVLGLLTNQDLTVDYQTLFDLWSGSVHRTQAKRRLDCICSSRRWVVENEPVNILVDKL